MSSSFELIGIGNPIMDLLAHVPESFLSDYVPRIQAVTATEVERAAKQYLQSDKFAVVIVGDLSKIEQPIRAANFGPVRVVTVDEILK